MSAIHTWACFFLWISLAMQDKTPGRTQTTLCVQQGVTYKADGEADTQIRFVERIICAA